MTSGPESGPGAEEYDDHKAEQLEFLAPVNGTIHKVAHNNGIKSVDYKQAQNKSGNNEIEIAQLRKNLLSHGSSPFEKRPEKLFAFPAFGHS